MTMKTMPNILTGLCAIVGAHAANPIITFRGKDYFFYHNGSIQHPNIGGSFRRAVCIDYLHYNPDGTMKRVAQTSEGIAPAK